MATQSTSTSVGVGSSNEPTMVEVIETTRNKDVWKHYDLCKMSNGSKKGRCKHCGKFISASSNSMLRLHFKKPYCPVLKIIPDGGQSSMSREGGLFVYEADRFFICLVIMGSQRTKEDDVQRISTSVFVTNFPEYACAKDLWNTCKQYGYVVDAFIPNKRSKAGKKFGFIGRHRIHANVAKFHRPTGLNRSKLSNQNEEYIDTSNGVKQDSGNRDNTKSYAYVVKGRDQVNGERDTNPVLVLDDSCVNK
ncbi:zinc finger, BED-type, phospholipase-like, homeodomain-like protein [Tanacetum coccineum]